MPPLVIAAVAALRRRERVGGITLEPLLDHIVIELLRPEHARHRLAHDVLSVGCETRRSDGSVELIGLFSTFCERKIIARAEGSARGRGHFSIGEPKLYGGALPPAGLDAIMAGPLPSR